MIFLKRMVLFVTALMIAVFVIEKALKNNFYRRYKSLTVMQKALDDIDIDLLNVYSGFRTLINI